jgi:hypothetical protein
MYELVANQVSELMVWLVYRTSSWNGRRLGSAGDRSLANCLDLQSKQTSRRMSIKSGDDRFPISSRRAD